MRKAGNLIEMPLILGVITVVAVGTLLVFNNQSLRLAVMSAINFRPVNLQTMSQDAAKQIVPYNRVETAGGNALTNIAMTSSDFESAITHTTYGEVKKALDETDSQGKNIADYANALIDSLGLDYKKLSSGNITSRTLSDLVGILNKVSSTAFAQEHPDQAANAKGFVERFKSVLTGALSNIANTTVQPNTNSSIASTSTQAAKTNYTYSNNNIGADNFVTVETAGAPTIDKPDSSLTAGNPSVDIPGGGLSKTKPTSTPASTPPSATTPMSTPPPTIPSDTGSTVTTVPSACYLQKKPPSWYIKNGCPTNLIE